jgi:glycerol-3-phosphate acyltransferase PlsY
MNILFFTLIGYLCGAIPFSVWLGAILIKRDVRQFGDDQNPGAANAWKAGKWRLGLPVLLLDFFKGAIPVGIARYGFGIDGWPLVPIALAPIIGHAFSIFLGFSGGKALAVTFGVWAGVSLYAGPSLLGLFFVLFYFSLDSGAWAAISGALAFGLILLISRQPISMDLIWAGNLLILVWKHRRELRRWPSFRTRLAGPG